MKLRKSMVGAFVFLFLVTMILAACGSSKSKRGVSNNRPYCEVGDMLGSCLVRKTYRRVVRLFPFN